MNYYEYNSAYGTSEEAGLVISTHSYYKWIFIHEAFNVVSFASEASYTLAGRYYQLQLTENMKAIAQPCVRPVEIAMKKDSMKVMKSKVDEQCAAEMQACFSKLKELVPSVPQDRKLSKTQLLQHVIDYILDLETALDFNPAVLSVPLPSVNRAPLSEKPEPNTIQSISQVNLPMDEDESCDTK